MPAGLTLAPASDSGVAGDNVTDIRTPTVTGSGEAGDTATLYDGMTPVGSATVTTGGGWSVTASRLAPGAHSLTAAERDPLGNLSAASPALGLTISQPARNDFYGAGVSDVLLHSNGGNVVTWLVSNGQYAGGTYIGTAPSDWKVVGAGDPSPPRSAT